MANYWLGFAAGGILTGAGFAGMLLSYMRQVRAREARLRVAMRAELESIRRINKEFRISGRGEKMIKYKLTDSEGNTQNNTHWEPGVTIAVRGGGIELCSDGVIHYTDSALLAVLLNPIQANIPAPLRLFEIEVRAEVAHDGLKGGTKFAKCIREIPVPAITPVQRVRFAILCAMQVYHEGKWVTWANNWLSGEDRTAAAARITAESMRTGEWTAAWSAWAATRVAVEAWETGETAAEAASFAGTAGAAAAAESAEAARVAGSKMNLVALAQQAVEDEK